MKPQHVGQARAHHQDGEDGSNADLAAQQGALPGQLPLHAVHQNGWSLGWAGGTGAHCVLDIRGLPSARSYLFKLVMSSSMESHIP